MQSLGAGRTVHKLAATIEADIIKLFRTRRAKAALEAANERARSLGGKIGPAAFAIGAHLKHFAVLLSRGAHGVAHPINNLLDLRGIVAFGHHPDHRFGARWANDQATIAFQLAFRIGTVALSSGFPPS